jgi:hypothetical protein
MSILHQFIESSTDVAERIKAVLTENEQLKQRVAELESTQTPKPEPNICDLMPIGETFCGLKVVDAEDGDSPSVIIVGESDDSEWINETTARAIYNTEMELRELRKMNPVIVAVDKWAKGSITGHALVTAFGEYLGKNI